MTAIGQLTGVKMEFSIDKIWSGEDEYQIIDTLPLPVCTYTPLGVTAVQTRLIILP